MKKTFLLILVTFFCGVTSLFAQQLTRFAVVDLPKVYTAFFRDSAAVRQFEERSSKVQAEIDKMNKEIQDLRSKHADLVLKGEQSQALKLENDIYRKSEFLREYYNTKMAELEDQRRKLTQAGSFLEQVNNELRYIAESEGYTMVINLKDNPSILWYSPTVDITDKLIQRLLEKSRR